MAITLTTLPQMDSTEATAAALATNTFYTDNLIEGIVAKTGQTDAHFSTSMPTGREAEYDAASTEDKNKFALIGALASIQVSTQAIAITYLDAWEEQYIIMFT